MRSNTLARIAMLAAGVIAPPLAGQTPPAKTPEQIQASYQAHAADFDYLLGDWEFTSEHREFGTARGYWSAARIGDGSEVLDEYRVVGDSGQTWYVINTLRSYNAVLDRWELISTGGGDGLQDLGTGRRVGNEMHIEQRFGVMSQSPSLWRIRYYDIRPDRFSWTADRSRDEGKTWDKGYLRIEARRIGPPRALPPLAPARNRIGSTP